MTTDVRSFFDKYYQEQVSFPVNEIDAVVGFFLKRKFSEQSAKTTSIALLNQARIDGVSTFSLVDSLNGLTDSQLTTVVSSILNSYRGTTSALGFRNQESTTSFEQRNIKL